MDKLKQTRKAESWNDLKGNQVTKITLRIDQETKEKLQEIAKRKNISLSKYIKDVLRDELERNK